MIGFLVCGPSGVGKTSHYRKMLTNAGIHKDIQVFDPDARSEETNVERSAEAFKAVKDAIHNGEDFVYTATCGGMSGILGLIRDMKKKKYRVVIAIVYTSLPVALERIRKRIHQPVPEVVEDLHAFFKTKAEQYMKLPVEIYLYNNETDFNLLLSKKNKKIVCRGEADFFFDISRYCSA
jgi:predicted ABC-type ATPase